MSIPYQTLTVNDVFYFGSGSTAKGRMLSNLYAAPVTLTPGDIPTLVTEAFPKFATWIAAKGSVTFPSSEHAWQSFKARDLDTFALFIAEGETKINTFNTHFFATLNPQTEKGAAKAVKSYNYWTGRQMIGILAKMATNPRNAAKLGLSGKFHRLEPSDARVMIDDDVHDALWHMILRAKFLQNKGLHRNLMSTGRAYLVEFGRMAHRRMTKWAGYFDKQTKRLYGDNYMGERLMAVRREFAR